MRKTFYLFVLAVAFGCNNLNAMSIGVGLHWRDIFVQEYWEDGVPYYAIANFRDETVKISLFAWRAEGEAKPQAGPWEIKAKSVLRVEAPRNLEGQLLSFRLDDGQRLGHLSAPESGSTKPEDRYASYDGLNGSGGRHADLTCGQATPAFKSMGVIEIKLRIPARTGILKFKKAAQRRLPDCVITEATIRGAESETAGISADDEYIVIDTNKAALAAKLHTVTLRFAAPKVAQPTMFYINGFLAISAGTGHGITRGVIIEP
jgi:hypothetical protein